MQQTSAPVPDAPVAEPSAATLSTAEPPPTAPSTATTPEQPPAPQTPVRRLSVTPELVTREFVLEELYRRSSAGQFFGDLLGSTANGIPAPTRESLGRMLARQITEELASATPLGHVRIVLRLENPSSAALGVQLAQGLANELRHRILLVVVRGAEPVEICPSPVTAMAGV